MQHLIHRLSIPNPFFEGRNSIYLIKSDPVTLVDSGIATDRAFEQLVEGLRGYGVSIHDVRRIVLTHKHIDHMGNAWRIQQASGAELLIHESECKSLTDVDPSGERFTSMVAEKLHGWHVPPQHLPNVSQSNLPAWKLENAEATPLVDGQQIEFTDGCLTVVHTPGHTMGSICLSGHGLLFSGDHVLRETSPNVGAGDMRSRGMLARYLSSLRKVSDLEDEPRVYPGHGESFEGLENRCRELHAHHQQRLEATACAIRTGAETVFEIAVALFGKLEDFHVVLGCAEANAHIELLVEQGRLVGDGGRYEAI